MRVTNTKLFIEKSNIVHNNEYDYGKVIFINSKSKVIINCKIHGEFEQKPNNHLSGFKCMKCSIEKRKEKRKSTDFIEKSKMKFKKKFDYSLVNYINNNTNIILKCDIHGDIKIIPSVHLKSKTGCSKCSTNNVSQSQKLDINKLLDRFNEIHKEKYNYSNMFYININSNIEIICKEHGHFLQTPKKHLSGSGCPVCISSKGEIKISNFLNDNNIKHKTQHSFKGCFYKRPLRFDFYLPNNNLVIEYDGEQHFKALKIFGGECAFNLQKIKDKIKDKWCIENQIKLVRIKYNEDIDKKMNEALNEI